jgi:para-nitrobenzyl esterase
LREVVGADLRGVGWEGLVGATMEMFGRTARWGYWPTPYLPVIDAATMPQHPADALAQADVDVLVGWTREEANFGFALNPGYADVTQEQVANRAGHRYADYAAARPGAGPLEVLMDLISDELFREPSLRIARERAAKQKPVWAYQFDYPSVAYDGRLGAAHCLELPFIFGNFDDWSPAPLVKGLDVRTRDGLSAAMHHAWIAFVRTGDPNHPALPHWDSFNEPTHNVLHFDSVISPAGRA